MSIYLLITGVAVGVSVVLYHTVVKGAKCKSKAKLHGKTVIIPGGNTGIGKALELARRGARAVPACRSRPRAKAAVCDIRRESGSSEVVYMQLELAILKLASSFAETFLKTEPTVDLLINDAGLLMGGRTEDGLGMMFGVNHLGHFLLTNLLLERLKEGGAARIVNVASLAHRFGSIDFDCLSAHKELGRGSSTCDLMKIYSHSKLCNVLFTHELAKRLQDTNVTCYSLHPGAINTEPQSRNANVVLRVLFMPITALFFLKRRGPRPRCTAPFRRASRTTAAATSPTAPCRKWAPKRTTTSRPGSCGK